MCQRILPSRCDEWSYRRLWLHPPHILLYILMPYRMFSSVVRVEQIKYTHLMDPDTCQEIQCRITTLFTLFLIPLHLLRLPPLDTPTTCVVSTLSSHLWSACIASIHKVSYSTVLPTGALALLCIILNDSRIYDIGELIVNVIAKLRQDSSKYIFFYRSIANRTLTAPFLKLDELIIAQGESLIQC